MKTDERSRKESNARIRRRAIAQGEAIRVVPVHQPKPAILLEELARPGEKEERDLFDGRPLPAPPDALLSYRGGILLPEVEVFTIFWGTRWGVTSSSQTLMNRINQFFVDIVTSPLIDQLGEYSVPGQNIGHGSFLGAKVIADRAPSGSTTDTAIRGRIKQWIGEGLVPKISRNTLYFVYLEPGVAAILSGSRSCQSFCGYHNRTGKIYYAVMPYPDCHGCLGGLKAFDAITAASSHELCEAITDPVPGTGWYDDVDGEVGDICAWSFKTVGGYKVQREWSNRKKTCV